MDVNTNDFKSFLGLNCGCNINENDMNQVNQADQTSQVPQTTQERPKLKKNVSYNSEEMVEVLTMIRDGQVKKVFNVIKEKDNVTMLDVIRVLVAKDKTEMIPRLIEMASLQGYLKI